MKGYDGRFLSRADGDIVAVRIGGDEFMTFAPKKRFDNFLSRAKKYRAGEKVEILDELKLVDISSSGAKWAINDWCVSVDNDKMMFLNYGLEDFCFSQQITRQVAWVKKRSEGEIKKAISENRFTFAKTMAHNPHEYAIRTKWNDGTITFNEMLEFMRVNHKLERFGQRMYRVSVIDGVRYWTMGGADAITIILNRGVE